MAVSVTAEADYTCDETRKGIDRYGEKVSGGSGEACGAILAWHESLRSTGVHTELFKLSVEHSREDDEWAYLVDDAGGEQGDRVQGCNDAGGYQYYKTPSLGV